MSPNQKQLRVLWYKAADLSRRNCRIRPSLCWVERCEVIGKSIVASVRAEAGCFKTYAVLTIGPRGGVREHVSRSIY
jgi:hypothetical protein